jgi:hypothetical protein
MNESSVIWRADSGGIGKVISLIDLLEQARDVMKQYPDASFTIVSVPNNKKITFSIMVDQQSFAMVANRNIPNVNALQSITIDCI